MLNEAYAVGAKISANKGLVGGFMEKIGLLAGIGGLPVEFVRAAKGMGVSVFTVGLVEGVAEELKKESTCFAEISVGCLEQVISFLKENGISKVTMLGKVTKELMFGGKVTMDQRMQKLLAALSDRSDDALMLAFIRELAIEGISVFDQTEWVRFLMPPKGLLTKRAPDEREQADMVFGFEMAKAIGGLDIGQTVVVKDLAVLAVEAIEGTDACILRGGALGAGQAVVVKVAKPQQDARFDVPAVGVKTLESMLDVGAKALAIEAGRTLLVDREKVIQIADENGITILAM